MLPARRKSSASVACTDGTWKGRSMAKHEVKLALPQGLVINTDVEFEVYSNGAKLGELHVSRGTIDWRPGRSKKAEYRMTWEQFADNMKANGKLTKVM